MRKEIPQEAYWKLRCLALEKSLGDERQRHIMRMRTLLKSTREVIEDLDLTLNEYGGVLAGTASAYTERYDELKAEIGGEIGMEGRPEDWDVKLTDEATSFMESKD